jgi:hypothetical protein
MTRYEELVAKNAALRKVLEAGAGEKLRRIPGVRHVSVGVKVRDRRPTDELCIRVYVRVKRPERELSPTERIPKMIDGVPTDVIVERPTEFTVDAARYRPLKGGIMISNQIIGLNASGTGTTMEAGTFGCTGTRNSDGAPVLLSNWHVIMANGARIGEPVFQPAPLDIPDVPLARLPVRRVDTEDIIAHISRAVVNETVDAAIAKLDVSSCCRCCGLDFRDEILGLSEGGKPPSNKILGLRAAVPQMKVYKVGITTGRTVGKVMDVNYDNLVARLAGVEYTFNGQIEIAADDPDEFFSRRGDSGAAVIDEDGYIVGLLFGSTDVPPDHRAYANHIADVCQEMQITINLTQGGGTAGERSAARRVTFPVEVSPTGAELYAKTRKRVESDPAGQWLWALAEEHREEIVTLVTTHRRVSVVWHRAGGPAIFATALNALRAGDDETLPVPPGGTLESAMASVGIALAMHGSEKLRAALSRHRDALLGAARGSTTLTEFLDKLRPHVHRERSGRTLVEEGA